MIVEIVLTTVKEFQEAYNVNLIDRRVLFFMILISSACAVLHRYYSGKKKNIGRKFFRYALYVNKNYIRDCNASWLFYNIVSNLSKESLEKITKLNANNNRILITESEFYNLDINKKRCYKKINNYYVICRFNYSESEAYVKLINKAIKEKIVLKSVVN